MTDNEKLARWQGWEEYHSDINKHVPDYLNDDAAAMSLLDTLVEKGYCPLLALNGTTNLWQCSIDEFSTIGKYRVHAPVVDDPELGRDTRREAVVSAVLELIERGDI